MASILTLAGAILNNLAEEEEVRKEREYQEKLTAWEKERERIAEANRVKAERAQRRNAMSSAIKSDIGYMPPKMQPVPGSSAAPKKEDSDNTYSNIAGVLNLGSGLIDQYGGVEGLLDKMGNESSIGNLIRGTSVSPTYQEAPFNDTLASASPSGTYNFKTRYNPERYLTS